MLATKVCLALHKHFTYTTPYKLPYTLFENPMTFNVFGLLKIQKLFYKNVRVVPSEAPIKLIYLGDTERLTTEMGERRGCEKLYHG